MKRTLLLSIVLLIVLLTADAGKRSTVEMLDIAQRALASVNVDASGNHRANSTVTIVPRLVADGSQYAVYSSEGRGFVVVSRRDDVAPVLASSASDYVDGDMPDGFRWWLSETERSLSQELSFLDAESAMKVEETVENFIPALWGQNAPFNDLCPIYSDNLRAPTGCVATALAMVLNYYQYPAKGKGKGGYVIHCYVDSNEVDTQEYIDVPVNGVYDWSKMKDVYTSKFDFSQAVATLMFDCGKSVYMEYSGAGSGAMIVNTAIAANNNFSYDSLAVNYASRSYFSDTEWYSTIRNELLNRRPVLYGGVDDSAGGHAFLFSGINTDGQVWVNWGWNGLANGWYYISHLQPESIKYEFAYGQEMTYGFRPSSEPLDSEANISMWGYDYEAPLEMYLTENKDISIKNTVLYNLTCRWFMGDICLFVEDEERQTVNFSYTISRNLCSQPMYGINISGFTNILNYIAQTSPSSLPAGNYRVSFKTKGRGDSKWQPVRKPGGNPYCYFSIGKDGVVSVDNDNSFTAIHPVIADTPASPSSSRFTLGGSNASEVYKGIVIGKGKKYVRCE